MAWIETRTRKRGKRYLVGWWEKTTLGRKKAYRSFPYWDEARHFKAEVERDLAIGSYVPQARRRRPLAEYIEEILEVQGPDLAQGTVQNYRDALENWVLKDPIALQGVGEVSEDNVRAFWSRLRAKQATSSTLFQVRKLLSKVYNIALAEGLVPRNPMKAIPVPRLENHDAEPYTSAEVEQIAAAIYPRYRALVLVLAYGGLRPGEAFGLEVERIDWDAAAIEVTRQVRGGLKSKTSKRRVSLPKSVMRELRWHIQKYPSEEGYVFTTSKGTPVGRSVFRRAWGKACRMANVTVGRPYDLRHTQASWLLGEGVSVPAAAERLGHSADVLLSTYAHKLKGADQAVADRLEALRQG